MRKISLLSILFFVLSACATSPEPEIFDIELISFETAEVPVHHDIVWFEPGYLLKFRSSRFIFNPKNIIENVVLMRCSDEKIVFQSGWVSAGTPSDNGSILYTAPFYKQTLDRLDLPNPLCSRVLIGKGKKFEEIKKPLFISIKVELELPI